MGIVWEMNKNKVTSGNENEKRNNVAWYGNTSIPMGINSHRQL